MANTVSTKNTPVSAVAMSAPSSTVTVGATLRPTWRDHDPRGRGALSFRRPGVILTELLSSERPDEPDIDGGEADRQRYPRQDEVVGPLHRALAEVHVPLDGKDRGADRHDVQAEQDSLGRLVSEDSTRSSGPARTPVSTCRVSRPRGRRCPRRTRPQAAVGADRAPRSRSQITAAPSTSEAVALVAGHRMAETGRICT